MKKRTKNQKFGDYFDAFKAVQEGRKVKRSVAKDGSIPTHPVVVVDATLSEAKVLKNCLTWLKSHRILANRNNVGSFQMSETEFYSYGIKNAGDIIGCLPNGLHFELEMKKGKGGRLSIGQQKRMEKVHKNNCFYFVIHGLPELEHYFKGLI